jgi:uncharacterized membrane protein YfcA
MMLVPVLVYAFGPQQAVPIMAVAAVMANISRILAWWRDVDWRACLAYAVTGIPGAALGAKTLLILPPRIVDITIGMFLIAMIPTRRWLAAHNLKLSLWHLTALGGLVGFVTGIVVSTGPITVPIFMSYGLVKGGFLGTEAAGSLAVYLSKTAAFQRFGALPPDVIAKGLITGSSLMIGTVIAKHFMLKLEPDAFRLLMDALMLISGLAMLWNAM